MKPKPVGQPALVGVRWRFVNGKLGVYESENQNHNEKALS